MVKYYRSSSFNAFLIGSCCVTKMVEAEPTKANVALMRLELNISDAPQPPQSRITAGILEIV
jgi:hypothetical protein